MKKTRYDERVVQWKDPKSFDFNGVKAALELDVERALDGFRIDGVVNRLIKNETFGRGDISFRGEELSFLKEALRQSDALHPCLRASKLTAYVGPILDALREAIEERNQAIQQRTKGFTAAIQTLTEPQLPDTLPAPPRAPKVSGFEANALLFEFHKDRVAEVDSLVEELAPSKPKVQEAHEPEISPGPSPQQEAPGCQQVLLAAFQTLVEEVRDLKRCMGEYFARQEVPKATPRVPLPPKPTMSWGKLTEEVKERLKSEGCDAVFVDSITEKHVDVRTRALELEARDYGDYLHNKGTLVWLPTEYCIVPLVADFRGAYLKSQPVVMNPEAPHPTDFLDLLNGGN